METADGSWETLAASPRGRDPLLQSPMECPLSWISWLAEGREEGMRSCGAAEDCSGRLLLP